MSPFQHSLNGLSLSPAPTWFGIKVPQCDWGCWMQADSPHLTRCLTAKSLHSNQTVNVCFVKLKWFMVQSFDFIETGFCVVAVMFFGRVFFKVHLCKFSHIVFLSSLLQTTCCRPLLSGDTEEAPILMHGAKWHKKARKGRRDKEKASEWVEGVWEFCLTVRQWTGWLFSISKQLASFQTWEAAGKQNDRSLYCSDIKHTHKHTAEKLPMGGWRREQPTISWNWMTWK